MKYSFLKYSLLLLVVSIHTVVVGQKIENLELPTITKYDDVIRHLGYTLSYNEQHEQANWVAYELTASETNKVAARSNKFEADEAVKSGSATNADYASSGYDRGHLAPAADMSWSQETMQESFFYSNMSPQDKSFNRGVWKRLEEQVRQWAVDNQNIYVVTGPVLKKNLPTIGGNKVSVPGYYYKVILDYTNPDIKGIGFILPNASSSSVISDFAVSIDSVESMTSINFFPALPDKEEAQLEKSFHLEKWSWTASHTKAKSVHSIEAKGERVQCGGLTKAGSRCKRMTKSASGYCAQHDDEK